MLAARIHRYGGPEALVVERAPEPEVGPEDVLVEVRAASVNPVDCKIRSGGQRAILHYRLPWILGLDFCGRIIATGRRVTRFAVGDDVYGSPSHRRLGTYAERLAVRQAEIAHKPPGLSHEEAASLPLVGLTAWDALVVKGRVRPGSKVLIHAGSGGVGTFAIQLAKSRGAHVITTCSSPNEALVRSLGADEVIDYHETRFEDAVSNCDLVLDAIGAQIRERSLAVLRRGGRLVTLVAGFPSATRRHGVVLGPAMAVFDIASVMLRGRLAYGVTVHPVVRSSDGQLLARISQLVEQGSVHPVVDRVFSLGDIAEAHRYSESGRVRGKIVIRMPG